MFRVVIEQGVHGLAYVVGICNMVEVERVLRRGWGESTLTHTEISLSKEGRGEGQGAQVLQLQKMV